MTIRMANAVMYVGSGQPTATPTDTPTEGPTNTPTSTPTKTATPTDTPTGDAPTPRPTLQRRRPRRPILRRETQPTRRRAHRQRRLRRQPRPHPPPGHLNTRLFSTTTAKRRCGWGSMPRRWKRTVSRSTRRADEAVVGSCPPALNGTFLSPGAGKAADSGLGLAARSMPADSARKETEPLRVAKPVPASRTRVIRSVSEISVYYRASHRRQLRSSHSTATTMTRTRTTSAWWTASTCPFRSSQSKTCYPSMIIAIRTAPLRDARPRPVLKPPGCVRKSLFPTTQMQEHVPWWFGSVHLGRDGGRVQKRPSRPEIRSPRIRARRPAALLHDRYRLHRAR